MPAVPHNDMSALYPHAPKEIAPGWHIAWGSQGPMFRRDDDYARYGHQAQLWRAFDVTRPPSRTSGNSATYGPDAYVTTSTNELICYLIEEQTPTGRRHRYVLPNGYRSRLYRTWVAAGDVAWNVMHAHDPNLGLPLPARVHGLADDAPTPPLPTPRAGDAVTRPTPRRATSTPHTPAFTATTHTTTTHTNRRATDHGGHQRTSSSGQTSGRAGGGSDHLVFDATECGDFGADH